MMETHLNKEPQMVIQLSSEQLLKKIPIDNKVVVSGDVDIKIGAIGTGCTVNGKNSVAAGIETTTFTDNSLAQGEGTIAGTHSFTVVSGDLNLNIWRLKSVDGLKEGMIYSVRVLNNYDVVGTILSVDEDEKIISVDGMPEQKRLRRDELLSDPSLSAIYSDYAELSNIVRGHPNPSLNNEFASTPLNKTTLWMNHGFDANTMWILGHPELGNLSAYATGAHAEGYNTIAGRQYSHAEGRETITQGKYAHSEGWDTIAAWCAHSEGAHTSAFGLYSHAQGTRTQARGVGSFAAGVSALTYGDNSFIWNGNPSEYYVRDMKGSFNVNPRFGQYGFYIGDTSIGDMIDDS